MSMRTIKHIDFIGYFATDLKSGEDQSLSKETLLYPLE